MFSYPESLLNLTPSAQVEIPHLCHCWCLLSSDVSRFGCTMHPSGSRSFKTIIPPARRSRATETFTLSRSLIPARSSRNPCPASGTQRITGSRPCPQQVNPRCTGLMVQRQPVCGSRRGQQRERSRDLGGGETVDQSGPRV